MLYIDSGVLLKKVRTSILREVTGSEAREELGNLSSHSFVIIEEKELRNRVTQVQREIEQLKIFLELPFISDETRDSAISKMKELENTLALVSNHIAAVLPTPMTEDWILPILKKLEGSKDEREKSVRDEFAHCKRPRYLFQTVFVARYVEDETQWRAIHVCITGTIHVYQRTLEVANQQTSICLIGFDPDSLSHFQNCPLPPIVLANLYSCTQNKFMNLLAKGCFVSIIPHTSAQELFQGGLVWKRLGRSLKDALGLYKKPLPTCLVDLSGYSINCPISSKSIRRTQKKPCQFCLAFRDALWNANTPRHSNSSFSCLFLSNSVGVRNKHLPYGGVN